MVDEKTTVKVIDNGPLYIEGAFTIVTASGKELPVEGNKVALCRCGASVKKPFCDGAHRQIGFAASEEA
jgi:CDGSH iron-sulfur domain-containing protein 3